MRYLYVCPKCKGAFYYESDIPNENIECKTCDVKLVYADSTKEEWDLKTEEQKTEFKNKVLHIYAEKVASTEYKMLQQLQNIEKSISTIKGILVFFTVMSVLGAIYMLISLN